MLVVLVPWTKPAIAVFPPVTAAVTKDSPHPAVLGNSDYGPSASLFPV